jgi:hypothetical protein
MLQFSANSRSVALPRNDVIGSLALHTAATAILREFDLRFDEDCGGTRGMPDPIFPT